MTPATITEPPAEVLARADWEALERIADRVRAAARARTLTPELFAELRAEALTAAGGAEELLETVDGYAPEGSPR